MIALPSKKSFESQLTIYFLVGVLVLSVVASSVISYITYERERSAFLKHGEEVAATLIEQTKLNYSGTIEELLSFTAKSVLSLESVEKVVVFNANYEQLFSMKNSKDLAIVDGWQNNIGLETEFIRETNQGFYYIAPIVDENYTAAIAYVMVILDKSSLFDYVQKIFLTSLGVILALALLLWLILNAVIRRLTVPLGRFSVTMNEAGSGV